MQTSRTAWKAVPTSLGRVGLSKPADFFAFVCWLSMHKALKSRIAKIVRNLARVAARSIVPPMTPRLILKTFATCARYPMTYEDGIAFFRAS